MSFPFPVSPLLPSTKLPSVFCLEGPPCSLPGLVERQCQNRFHGFSHLNPRVAPWATLSSLTRIWPQVLLSTACGRSLALEDDPDFQPHFFPANNWS